MATVGNCIKAKACETNDWYGMYGMRCISNRARARLPIVRQTSKSKQTNINQRSSDFVGMGDQQQEHHRQQIMTKEK